MALVRRKCLLNCFSIPQCLQNVVVGELQTRHHATKAEIEKRQTELMSRSLPKQKSIPGVKHILLVASGKGGVGKSTTAVNLATALATLQPKLEVGLLDADVYGPSVPLMMNLDESPFLTEDDLMIPLVNYGVKCMSMGFLITEQSAVMWRGLMVMNALEKLMRKVQWGPLDCLVIDSPPGTGDAHLSLVQNLPITGCILVTTPQKAALQVVKRGITMMKKLRVPVVGLVENMSTVKCPKCDNLLKLFGSETQKLVEEQGIEILQDIPLDSDITNSGDSGKPIVVSKPDSIQASLYLELAKKVAKFLREQTPNQSDEKT